MDNKLSNNWEVKVFSTLRCFRKNIAFSQSFFSFYIQMDLINQNLQGMLLKFELLYAHVHVSRKSTQTSFLSRTNIGKFIK